MTYIPTNHRVCPLEAECGPEHITYEWRDEERLEKGWTMATEGATEDGWDRKHAIAVYHWLLLAGKGHTVTIRAADSWKSPSLSCETNYRPESPIVLIRVHLVSKWSQYMGYISPEGFGRLATVDDPYRHKRVRLVLQSHLTMGLPIAQKTLFPGDKDD